MQVQPGGIPAEHQSILALARDAHDVFEHGDIFLPQIVRHLRTQRVKQELFAFRLEDGVAGGQLVVRDLLGAGHAAQKELLDLVVERGDFGAGLLERAGLILLHNRSPPDRDR